MENILKQILDKLENVEKRLESIEKGQQDHSQQLGRIENRLSNLERQQSEDVVAILTETRGRIDSIDEKLDLIGEKVGGHDIKLRLLQKWKEEQAIAEEKRKMGM
jgi:chromosome segregation ATPase